MGGQRAADRAGPALKCPNCAAEIECGLKECPHCGVIFAKWRERAEREHEEARPEPLLATPRRSFIPDARLVYGAGFLLMLGVAAYSMRRVQAAAAAKRTLNPAASAMNTAAEQRKALRMIQAAQTQGFRSDAFRIPVQSYQFAQPGGARRRRGPRAKVGLSGQP